jgi:hypothetical protein
MPYEFSVENIAKAFSPKSALNCKSFAKSHFLRIFAAMQYSPLYRFGCAQLFAALATVFFIVARFGALCHIHKAESADVACGALLCHERHDDATPQTPSDEEREDCSLCDVLAWQATGAVSFVAHLSSPAFFPFAPICNAQVLPGIQSARPSDRAPPALVLS